MSCLMDQTLGGGTAVTAAASGVSTHRLRSSAMRDEGAKHRVSKGSVPGGHTACVSPSLENPHRARLWAVPTHTLFPKPALLGAPWLAGVPS